MPLAVVLTLSGAVPGPPLCENCSGMDLTCLQVLPQEEARAAAGPARSAMPGGLGYGRRLDDADAGTRYRDAGSQK